MPMLRHLAHEGWETTETPGKNRNVEERESKGSRARVGRGDNVFYFESRSQQAALRAEYAL